MMRVLFAAALGVIVTPVLAADVGVSVNIGQPGFYGRIEIGNAPRPQLIYPEPVIVERAPGNAPPRPVYLYVPPEHAKDWRRHCHRYNACGQPVYFVQKGWYEDVYVPHYRTSHAQVVYAHDIHSDVVRARVIWAHAVHAKEVRARVVYESDWKGEPQGKGKGKDKGKGYHDEDIRAQVVSAGEIHAHDIHARVVEADTLYVKDLHTKR